MKARLVAAAAAAKDVLFSAELRPAEVTILRAVAVAVAVKLGVDVSGWV